MSVKMPGRAWFRSRAEANKFAAKLSGKTSYRNGRGELIISCPPGQRIRTKIEFTWKGQKPFSVHITLEPSSEDEEPRQVGEGGRGPDPRQPSRAWDTLPPRQVA